MIKDQVSIDDTIQFLNELIEMDRNAMAALFANRVPCNERLANHPTVQVRAQHGGYHVGMTGILNGLFGADEDGWGPIALIFDETVNGKYANLLRVERTPPREGRNAQP